MSIDSDGVESDDGGATSKVEGETSARGEGGVGLFDLEDLYLAYRKAKMDLVMENFQPKLRELARFEKSLDENLRTLYDNLRTDLWHEGDEFAGRVNWVPKRIKFRGGAPHCAASNNGFSEWEYIRQGAKPIEFRPYSDLSVVAHVVAALWIYKVGEHYDSMLSGGVFGIPDAAGWLHVQHQFLLLL